MTRRRRKLAISSLDGAVAKLERGLGHVEALRSLIKAAAEQDMTITFSQEFEPSSNMIVVTIAEVPKYPVEWALVAADAAQNFRTALNYLAWELARWNLSQQGLERPPNRNTQFPIADSQETFNTGWVADIAREHVDLVREMQPFGPRHLSMFPAEVVERATAGLIARSPLFRLRELTNTDKHRVLQLMALSSSETGLGSHELVDCEAAGQPNYFLQVTFREGAVWAHFPVKHAGPHPRVEMRDYIVPQVAFEDGWAAIPILDDIGKTVRSVLDELSPVFQDT